MIAGTLELQMMANIAKLSDDMHAAKNVVGSAMDDIMSKVNQAQNLLMSLGVMASIGGLLDLANNSIAAAAGLNKMSEATGVSVGSLSAMRSEAKLSGTSMDDVAAALVKLSKNMVASQDDTSKAARAFDALGVSIWDGNGKMKTADQMMLDIAKSIQGFGASANLTTAKLDTMGKSSANLSEFLNDLAIKGDLVGKITAEQSAKAEEYERSLIKLKMSTEGVVRSLALDFLPVLVKLTDLFKPALEVAGSLALVFWGFPALCTLAVAAFNAYAVSVYEGTAATAIFGTTVATLGPTFATMTATFGLFQTVVMSGLGVLIAAFAGWKIGEWLSDNFLVARLAATAFVDGTMTAWEYLKYAGNMLWLGFQVAFESVREVIGTGLSWIFEKVSNGLRAIGLTAFADSIGIVSKELVNATAKTVDFDTESAVFKTQLDAGVKSVHDITNSMADQAIAHFNTTKATRGQTDEVDLLIGKNKEAIAEQKKYEGALQSLEQQLGKLNNMTQAEIIINQVTTGSLKDLTLEHKAVLIAVAGEIDQRKEAADILKAETTYRKALDEIMQKSNDTIAAARIAAKAQADQYEFEISLIGKTSFEIQVLNAQRQIEVEYRAKLKALGAIYRNDVAGFNAAVAALNAITQGQRDRLIPALERRNQLERDWSTGAVAAYNEYVNGATNAAKQGHDIWAATFKGMEDAAYQFFRTGELSATSMINVLKDQLARLAAQKFTVWITGELSGIGTTLLDALGLGNLMKSVTGGGAGAAVTGGAVVAGGGAAVTGGGSAATLVGGGASGAATIGIGTALAGAAAVIVIGELLKQSQRPFELAGTGALSTSGLSVEKQMPNGSEWFTPTSASYQKLKFTDGDMGFAYQVMGDGIPIAAVDAATFVNQYHGPASAVSFHGIGGQLAGAKDYQLTEVADLLASFTAEGYDAATLLWAGATNYGLSEADLRLAGKSRSLPGFYAGGMFEGGLRIVGERGPELEATGPSRIFDAQTTASMLRSGGASNEDVVTELRAMRVQLAQLQQEARRTADATNGNPEAPMLTEVVV